MFAAMMRQSNILVFLIWGLATTGCVSSGKYDGVVADLKKCQDDHAAAMKDRDEKIATLQKQLGDTTLERDKASAHGSELEGTMSATQKELAELRKQHEDAEKRLAAFRALTSRFQKMIDAGKIKVAFRNGQMIMKLPAGILFASGRADLSKDGHATLSEVAGILKEFADRKFLIAGHTDNLPLPGHGRFKDNWELSTARALTVARYLVSQGVNSQSLGAAGYAEFDPVADNATDQGRQDNRRIEIVVVPNISEMPKLPENG
jgi:chemotaxis protein MotB